MTGLASRISVLSDRGNENSRCQIFIPYDSACLHRRQESFSKNSRRHRRPRFTDQFPLLLPFILVLTFDFIPEFDIGFIFEFIPGFILLFMLPLVAGEGVYAGIGVGVGVFEFDTT